MMRMPVLIVEADAALRESLARSLAYENFLPYTASGAAEALALLARHAVGMLLVEVRPPEMSGWELVAAVRAKHGRLPAIAMTDAGGQMFTAAAFEVDALVTKPVVFPVLLKLMRDLARPGSRPGGPAVIAPAKAREARVTVLD